MLFRVVGVVLFVVGCGGTALSTWASFRSRRPRDIGFTVLAPVAMIVALTGLLLAFVPGFFG